MAMASSMLFRRPVGRGQAGVSRVAMNVSRACVVQGVPGVHRGSALGLVKENSKRARRVVMRSEPEGAPKDAKEPSNEPKDTKPAAEAAKEVAKEVTKDDVKEVAKEPVKEVKPASEPEIAKGGAVNIDELPEIERKELSSGMKEKMRQEYLGLGGAENTPMGANYFLYIIIIISVLAVLSKLTGAI